LGNARFDAELTREAAIWFCSDHKKYNKFMTTTVTATFDGKVLIPSEEVDLPRGTVLRLQVELEPLAEDSKSLRNDPACGIWADRTDLGETSSAARQLRRRVEKREDHAQ
jgi:hypothetical protein